MSRRHVLSEEDRLIDVFFRPIGGKTDIWILEEAVTFWRNVRYYGLKMAQFILALMILSLAVFCISRWAPGDPLRSFYGDGVERLSTEERDAAVARLGLDKPVLEQYGLWLSNAFHGDFGISFKYKRDVMEVIGGVYENTLLLGGISFVLTFGLAILLGVFCAMREDSPVDRIVCKVGTILNCMPSFWVALLLILIFCVNLKILPSSGAYDIGMEQDWGSRLSHLILPTAVMVLGHLWYYAYMIRNKLLFETKQDYVLLCRAKGLSRRAVMYKHCLRNIMPSIVAVMAISVPHIIGGTYVVEKVFSYPGLGALSFESAQYHDYNMLMVICMITGVLVVFFNILAQIINDRIDPRMRRNRGEGVYEQ